MPPVAAGTSQRERSPSRQNRMSTAEAPTFSPRRVRSGSRHGWVQADVQATMGRVVPEARHRPHRLEDRTGSPCPGNVRAAAYDSGPRGGEHVRLCTTQLGFRGPIPVITVMPRPPWPCGDCLSRARERRAGRAGAVGIASGGAPHPIVPVQASPRVPSRDLTPVCHRYVLPPEHRRAEHQRRRTHRRLVRPRRCHAACRPRDAWAAGSVGWRPQPVQLPVRA
jgi:hypothetical protein